LGSRSRSMKSRNPWLLACICFPIENIVQNAVNSADRATLVAAVKAGGLVETLEKRLHGTHGTLLLVPGVG
jgi:hypothetical protein